MQCLDWKIIHTFTSRHSLNCEAARGKMKEKTQWERYVKYLKEG